MKWVRPKSMEEVTRTSVRERIFGVIPKWLKWGPYLAERSWGTVREDYSLDGNSWSYFPYRQAHLKSYRWGDDGIAGICDRYQVLYFSLALWNGKDSHLKERLFGLTPQEGNHGEDVKEIFYYLDNNPQHSYMKYLYKYPQESFPYQRLIEENKKRTLEDPEFELVDTGIFDGGRYFDIFIEYAKATPEDICIRITAHNRGDQEAQLHLIPQLTFRNFWQSDPEARKIPTMFLEGENCIVADDSYCDPVELLNYPYRVGQRFFYGQQGGKALFTNNETNHEALFTGKNATPFVKDGFHRHIIHHEESVNPELKGTKACFHYKEIKIPAGGSETILLRLTDHAQEDPFKEIDEIFTKRQQETEEFYSEIHPSSASTEEKEIQRQAFAGMLWSKQIYLYDVHQWINGDKDHLTGPGREKIRNEHWKHLVSKRILSMPDKWEYPWFAAWDLAFHCITYALIDLDFAKTQLWLLLFDQFQHPNGQIPAYEWEFSDLNPPVQAWAAWRIYQMEGEKRGEKDRSFLKKCFHKLILNFVWWVNRVDRHGNNVFEGGFLGLDNITIIDRSMEIPGGGTLEQSDGTGWMGMFCLLLMRIALELAEEDPDYEALAVKFFEHYVYIAAALTKSPNRQVQIWNDQDGFFYDVLSTHDLTQQIFVRSLVGIIPLYAVDSIEEEKLQRFPEFKMSFEWFMKNRSDLTDSCITPIEKEGRKSYLLALIRLDQIKRVLTKAWDPNEFRSSFGLRSLSKFHEKNPYHLHDRSVSYEPGESRVLIKGGNSNWRGPIWFPTNYLLIEALKKLHSIVGDGEKVEIPGEPPVTFLEMAKKYADSLVEIFKVDSQGKRPLYGEVRLFQEDPHFKDYLLFYEYYHGDLGKGLGASHQTGWSGLVANLIDEFCN